jgi:large subunit ribosomal protein L17
MRHRTSTRSRLTQKPAHSRMLQRNLVTSLLLYESVRTTKSRAQAIQPIVDRLIVTAKKSTPREAIRRINQTVTNKNACRKLLEVFVERYADRSSGFTQLTPAGSRHGDGAMLVDLTLVEGKEMALPPAKEPSKEKSKAQPRASKKTAKKASSSPKKS